MSETLQQKNARINQLEQTIQKQRAKIADLEEIRKWEHITEQCLVKALQDVYDSGRGSRSFIVACDALVLYTKRTGARNV